MPGLALVILALTAACERTPDSDEVIIARIGDRTISRNEFISRAEYTIRPPFAKGDHYIQRKIVLNSLVAEKLFALEAGEKNELAENEQFQLYIQGRREQAMRQWLYNEDFHSKVRLDTTEQKAQFKLAGRTYKLAYLSLPDSAAAGQITRSLQQGRTLEEAFAASGGLAAELPKREMTYFGQEPAVLHRAVYGAPLKKGQIIGPIRTDAGYQIIARVEGWTDRVAITETDVKQRWQDVSEKLREQKAMDGYVAWIGGLMRGKVLRFDGQTFPRVAQMMGEFYMASDEKKKALLKRQIWNSEDTTQTTMPVAYLDDIAELPFMVLDNQVWTVKDLQKLLLRHPLVFRTKQIGKGEFAREFRNAIADLIRDLAITEEAYKKGYDKVPVVERNVAMWRDNLMATYERNRWLREKGVEAEFYKNYLQVIDRDLNPYFAALRQKHGGEIEINTDEFEKIELTRIDMFATQDNVPFPVVVPSFPLLTTHNMLDYGRKMKAKK